MRIFWILVLVSSGTLLMGQPVDEQYMKGSAFALQGAYKEAVEQFTQVIYRNNSNENIFLKRGAAYMHLNQYDEALKDFNEANQITPQIADIWIARIYALEGNPEMAVYFLKSHLTSSYRLSEDSIKKDAAFDKIQTTPEWFELWDKEWYSQSENSISEAQRYIKRRQYDKAISLMDEAFNAKNDYRFLVVRGNAFMGQQNYAAAAGDYSSALNMQKLIPGVYEQRGMAYLKTGRQKEAVNDFSKAIKEDPADFNLYRLRAEAYAGLENWSSSIRDMQVYLKYFENDMDAVYICGTYYYENADYINALKCFNRNLKDDPSRADYYKARGKAYYKSSTFRYAANDLSMALDLNPADSEAWMYYGLASIKAGDKESGCSSLNKSKNLGNNEVLQYIIELCQ